MYYLYVKRLICQFDGNVCFFFNDVNILSFRENLFLFFM